MINICVIGSGALGSRHLQSLASIKNENVNVYVVDPLEQALINAKELYNSCSSETSPRVFFCLNLKDIEVDNNCFDVVIIASNAKYRKEIIVEVLDSYSVKYFLLEKVLFQKIDDYYEIQHLLQKKEIKSWVNCPRRYFEIYKKLKEELKNANSMEILVSGGHWGMACNSIHFLDLISYLAGHDNIQISTQGLDNDYIESKRPGFLEVTGTITGSMGKCKNFSITSYRDNNLPVSIVITSDLGKYVIFENKSIIYDISVEGTIKVENFNIPYQSQLTSIEVMDIINSGHSDLATLEESTLLHIALLKELVVYFKNRGVEGDICPIT